MAKVRKKTKKKLLTFIAIGIIVLVCGVGYFYINNQDKEQQGEDKKPPQEDVVKEPEKKLQILDLDSNSRPYAVMINNNQAVWKYQSGMNDAYIVYEMLVEGGITREMSLYKDKYEGKVASVRSSRHYFLDYAIENDAIYVHWGWSPQAESDIKSMKVNNINGLTYEGTYFFRDKSITGVGIEHKGYTTLDKVKQAAEKLKYRTTTNDDVLLKYSIDSLDLSKYEGVMDAGYVEVPYSGGYKARFFYDSENKVYLKSQNNTEMIDYTSKERIKTKNIILYNVSYKTIDSYGRQDMNNTGSGTGYFISEGKAVPITWSKSGRTARTVYKYNNGDTLVVNDGSTYIGLMPSNKQATISVSNQ